MKTNSFLHEKSPEKENRFNRLLPALGYVSHDFKNASNSKKSEEGWVAAKPNRILQGIEPYQYLTEITSFSKPPPAQLSSKKLSPTVSQKFSKTSLRSHSKELDS